MISWMISVEELMKLPIMPGTCFKTMLITWEKLASTYVNFVRLSFLKNSAGRREITFHENQPIRTEWHYIP